VLVPEKLGPRTSRRVLAIQPQACSRSLHPTVSSLTEGVGVRKKSSGQLSGPLRGGNEEDGDGEAAGVNACAGLLFD
jgi:hypothetical protein